MKKNSILLYMALAVTLILAACGGSEEGNEAEAEGEAASEGKQTVTFWHAMGGQAQTALDDIVAGYNESQDKVEVVAEYQGSYDEALTMFNSVAGTDSAPTMMQVFEIGTQTMIDGGQITPIQEFIDAEDYDMSNLEENITTYYSEDDMFYSMPFNSSTPVMYYNKDAFEEAGLDAETPPETYEAVEEAGRAITESNPDMKGFSLQAYGWLWEQLLANQGAQLLNNENGRESAATEIGWSDEQGLSILQWVENMVNDGTFANYGTNGDNMAAGFLAGDVAMYMQSSASVREVVDNADFEVGVAFIPHPEGTEREGVVIGGASLWMMNGAPEEEQQAAWEFMKYLQQPEVQAEWHVNTGYFAINPAAYEEEIAVQAHEETPQLQVTIDQLQSTTPSNATQGALGNFLPEGRQVVESGLESVYNGEDIEAAHETIVENYNQVIEQSNAAQGN